MQNIQNIPQKWKSNPFNMIIVKSVVKIAGDLREAMTVFLFPIITDFHSVSVCLTEEDILQFQTCKI